MSHIFIVLSAVPAPLTYIISCVIFYFYVIFCCILFSYGVFFTYQNVAIELDMIDLADMAWQSECTSASYQIPPFYRLIKGPRHQQIVLIL